MGRMQREVVPVALQGAPDPLEGGGQGGPHRCVATAGGWHGVQARGYRQRLEEWRAEEVLTNLTGWRDAARETPQPEGQW